MTKILCVDDDAEGMASRKEVLESEGHEVWQALSAREALRVMQSEEIDLAIVDYYLAFRLWAIAGGRRGNCEQLDS
jgi:CheY-like chemotaxis protein